MVKESNMKVLIIGSGGREHTLTWKVAQSPRVSQVFVAPGNAGTALEEKCENVAIQATDIDALLRFVRINKIDLTIVGPEQPLVEGIVDAFEKEGQRIFGPTKTAAALEGSKAFAKDFFKKYNIPTAAYEMFTDLEKAEEYIQAQGAPIVIKADGLAAGKGVLVAHTVEEALAFTRGCLSGEKFGDAGSSVVIEEFMDGEEASHTSICNGEEYLSFPSSQDHKLSLDGDKGLNTGGMGAYSPAPVVTEEVEEKIRKEIVEPVLKGMKEEGRHFIGFLYVGLMIKDGQPRVVEINVRFGDPEAQPVIMRSQNDLVELIDATLSGTLSELQMLVDPRAAMCVVMAAGGYPEKYEKGHAIHGLEEAGDLADTKVFHAGTKEDDGNVVTAGGRVLGVTALGDEIEDAQKAAYEAVEQINWKDAHYRTDIGWRAL